MAKLLHLVSLSQNKEYTEHGHSMHKMNHAVKWYKPLFASSPCLWPCNLDPILFEHPGNFLSYGAWGMMNLQTYSKQLLARTNHNDSDKNQQWCPGQVTLQFNIIVSRALVTSFLRSKTLIMQAVRPETHILALSKSIMARTGCCCPGSGMGDLRRRHRLCRKWDPCWIVSDW